MPAEISPAAWLASLPESEQLETLQTLAPTDADRAALAYCWPFWARPSQLPPSGWTKWLVMAGRGFGKTRTGAEWVVDLVREHIAAGHTWTLRIALCGLTPADVRKVMVEGESGILACCPPWMQPVWNKGVGELQWHDDAGNLIVLAESYSGANPEKLRGPQHHYAWADELAAWKYPSAWDNLMFGLRLGHHPQVVVTTTPRPVRTIRSLSDDAKRGGRGVVVTSGSTYDNISNLPQIFVDEILSKYEGTTLGQQEIYAQLLDETPGALWKRILISSTRVPRMPDGVEIVRLVVAVDPAATSRKDSDETGIVVAALGDDGMGYVLADLSGIHTPLEWGTLAVNAYHEYGADCIVGEGNNGGEMVETIIHGIDENAAFKMVWASKGKYARAEPIAAKYEQRRVHHVGVHDDLEDQMCTWLPTSKESPDRMDALVWALSDLLLGPGAPLFRTLADEDEDSDDDSDDDSYDAADADEDSG